MSIAIIIVLSLLCIWFNIRYMMIHKELVITRSELSISKRKLNSSHESYRIHMVNMAQKVDRFAEAFEEWNSKKD